MQAAVKKVYALYYTIEMKCNLVQSKIALVWL